MPTRRSLLAMGAGLVSAGLAGCSQVDRKGQDTDDYEPMDPIPPREEWEQWAKEEQIQPVPRPSEVISDGVPTDDGEIKFEMEFDMAHPDPDENQRLYNSSADKINYEIYVYDTHPLADEIEFTKISEVTSRVGIFHKQNWGGERYHGDNKGWSIFVDMGEIPKNRSTRFRIKGTNLRTGESAWVYDRLMFDYIEYDGAGLYARTEYDVEPIGDANTTILQDRKNGQATYKGTWIKEAVVGDQQSYKWYLTGDVPVSSIQIAESIPYSYESYELWDPSEVTQYPEYELQNESNPSVFEKKPDQWEVDGRDRIEDISNGGISPTTIEMSKSKLEELSWIEDNIGIYNNRNGLRFYQDTTPERFDVVNSYSVLDNPLLNEVANTINEAANEYGIDNHFNQINTAAKLVQSNEYKGRIGVNRTEAAEGVSIPTPETYWMSEKSENCVGHTFQLSWLLYHLGYTCGAVHFSLEDPPNHQGVAMPVPGEVLREEFDGPLERYQIIDADGKRFINETIDFSFSNPPESLGDYPWIYIETTAESRVGEMPFSEQWVRDPKVMLAIEPDDNKFNTNILSN